MENEATTLDELYDWLIDAIDEKQEFIGHRALSAADSAWLTATYAVVMRIEQLQKEGKHRVRV